MYLTFIIVAGADLRGDDVQHERGRTITQFNDVITSVIT
jgi:hypothetical protein